MKIVKTQNQNRAVQAASAVLKKGGLLIYPTETCYGLGADATNAKAVAKILAFKGSRGGKPISLAVSDKKMAAKYVIINETAENLYRHFLPGPLTVVSKSCGRTVKTLEAGRKTLGVRIPDHLLARKIIQKFGRPITSTSANSSGRKPPYSLADFLRYTPQKSLGLVDLFLDQGVLPFHLPSTVVDTTLNEPKTLRQGEIKIAARPGQVFVSASEERTREIARRLLKKYRSALKTKCLVFALQGELGAGKTRFAQGLGRALGIKEKIISPTFTIIREYPFGQKTFFHIDTWRLEEGKELLGLGLAQMFKPGNVLVIEWLQKIQPLLRKAGRNRKIKLIRVNLEHLSENQRRISYDEK